MRKGSYRPFPRPWFSDFLAQVAEELGQDATAHLEAANRGNDTAPEGFDPGGAFDGFSVYSDADPGL